MSSIVESSPIAFNIMFIPLQNCIFLVRDLRLVTGFWTKDPHFDGACRPKIALNMVSCEDIPLGSCIPTYSAMAKDAIASQDDGEVLFKFR